MWWPLSDSPASPLLLLPWGVFVEQKSPPLHFEEICDGGLSAFAWWEPIALPGGHLKVLLLRCGWAARHRRTLPRGRWGTSFGSRSRVRWSDNAAAVKSRHFLTAQLLPLDVGTWARLLPLEVEIPSLVGQFHPHMEHPLEVLLQLLVVHRPKQIPLHWAHL